MYTIQSIIIENVNWVNRKPLVEFIDRLGLAGAEKVKPYEISASSNMIVIEVMKPRPKAESGLAEVTLVLHDVPMDDVEESPVVDDTQQKLKQIIEFVTDLKE